MHVLLFPYGEARETMPRCRGNSLHEVSHLPPQGVESPSRSPSQPRFVFILFF